MGRRAAGHFLAYLLLLFVAIGVSYSGVLASWFRQKYPHLVDAVWASSSPVLAVMDFYKAYSYIGDLYKVNGGQTCYDNIQRLFTFQNDWFVKNKTDELKVMNNICQIVDMTGDMSKWIYFQIYTRHFHRVLQGLTIRKLCVRVKNLKSAKRRFHSLGCKLYNFGKERSREEKHPSATGVQSVMSSCNGQFENECDSRAFDLDLGSYTAWEWLTCSELGYFMTTTSKEQPFGNNNPLEYYITRCRQFGEEFTESFINDRIERTNEEYGGLTPNVSNVVFVNGVTDFWSVLGVKTTSLDNAAFLHSRGHGDDLLYYKRNKNISELKALRRTIIKMVKSWIQ